MINPSEINSPVISKKQLTAHRANGFQQCPYCTSPYFDVAGIPDVSPDGIVNFMRCRRCGKMWEEHCRVVQVTRVADGRDIPESINEADEIDGSSKTCNFAA